MPAQGFRLPVATSLSPRRRAGGGFAHFVEKNAIKRDEIAARQAGLLQRHQLQKGKLRFSDVQELCK